MATATFKKGKLYELPIADVQPDPKQPRKSMDSQASLNILKTEIDNYLSTLLR